MGFYGTLQWWDEWQLRVLVLGSLSIQYFLFFSTMVRRLALPPWLRLCIWFAYLGGDALAIYALATIFIRHKQQPAGGSGLEALWAPILLLHLAGQHPMTAYSIQDSELWERNVITVLSQVTIALYVFCESWSGEKRLLPAAILLFVVGIIRSCQKPCSLKNATAMDGSFSQEADAKEKDISPQEFVVQAKKWVLESELAGDQQKADPTGLLGMYLNRLLVDISVSYSTRIKILQEFMALDTRRASRVSEALLLKSSLYLYTRISVTISRLGHCLHLLLPFITLASVILLSTGQKYHGYNTTDVKVTYILFSCTALLDFLILLVGPCIGAIGSVKISMYSLWLCGSRTKRPTILMKLARVLRCKDYVNTHCYIEQAPAGLSNDIAVVVHGYVRDGWNKYIHDVASYRRFNSRRGEWTLRSYPLLKWSLNMEFDRSVLVWHIATDHCLKTTTLGPEFRMLSMVISHYMAYLLRLRPEMLMTENRKHIFTVACHDVELVLCRKSPLGDLVPNAYRLHQDLLELRDERERWEVVQGVWVEMLCYSASRCSGYLHAKNLSEGMELLSHVWLLWSFMGMETFTDMYQNPGPPETMEEQDREGGQDNGAGRAVENEINTSVV